MFFVVFMLSCLGTILTGPYVLYCTGKAAATPYCTHTVRIRRGRQEAMECIMCSLIAGTVVHRQCIRWGKQGAMECIVCSLISCKCCRKCQGCHRYDLVARFFLTIIDFPDNITTWLSFVFIVDGLFFKLTFLLYLSCKTPHMCLCAQLSLFSARHASLFACALRKLRMSFNAGNPAN